MSSTPPNTSDTAPPWGYKPPRGPLDEPLALRNHHWRSDARIDPRIRAFFSALPFRVVSHDHIWVPVLDGECVLVCAVHVCCLASVGHGMDPTTGVCRCSFGDPLGPHGRPGHPRGTHPILTQQQHHTMLHHHTTGITYFTHHAPRCTRRRRRWRRRGEETLRGVHPRRGYVALQCILGKLPDPRETHCASGRRRCGHA